MRVSHSAVAEGEGSHDLLKTNFACCLLLSNRPMQQNSDDSHPSCTSLQVFSSDFICIFKEGGCIVMLYMSATTTD